MFRSSRDVLNVPKPDNSTESDGSDVYGCDLCPEGGWVSETEVELHKTKEHYTRDFLKSVWERGDYCCICVKKCDSKEAVLKHIKTEHLLSSEQSLRVEREIFVCDLCSGVFFNQKNLMIHLRYSHKTHGSNAVVMCMLCARNIRTRNIPAHFYMHQIQSVSTCRICLQKFRNTRVLEEHIKKHPLFLKCTMCQFETDRRDSFQDHILETHKTLRKNDSLLTRDTNNRGSLMTSETKSDDGSTSKTDHSAYEIICDENDDSEMVTVIQIYDDAEVTDDATDGEDLVTVNDLMNDVIQDELIDTDLMTVDEKKKPLTDDITDDYDINEDLVMDDVKEEFTIKKFLKEDVGTTVRKDFKRFFIPKKSAFVKLQKVAGIKGLVLTNNVHICVLCREICVGSEEMRLHVHEHTYTVKTVKKCVYECSCGQSFHSKLLLRHHTFKTKHVIDTK